MAGHVKGHPGHEPQDPAALRGIQGARKPAGTGSQADQEVQEAGAGPGGGPQYREGSPLHHQVLTAGPRGGLPEVEETVHGLQEKGQVLGRQVSRLKILFICVLVDEV